ncbi:MAG TPA: molybdopterin cofactor-binding domain-containing protein [Caulobacteraceae bacterium]|nr:molybdopterin cofactor-binding domain-containing protein [Caulobacteraceae bacterium]
MNVDRRRFVTWSLGGAFLLAIADPATGAPEAAAVTLNPWIRIDPNGSITLCSTVSDMGQGSRTGQVQILADELEAPWEAIQVVDAPDADPFRVDGEIQTGGSESIRTRFALLRAAGATARAQLIAAAAARWGVAPTTCEAKLGWVAHGATGRRLAYGALAVDAAAQPPPATPPLKDPAQWRYIGKSVGPLGRADRVTGAARYGIDVRVPGMLRATLRQAPVFGATLVSVDEAPALATPGVVKVVRLPAAVAVVGRSTWAAFAGARALSPKWQAPAKTWSSPEIGPALIAAYDGADSVILPDKTGAEAKAKLRAVFAAAARKIEATYEVPYLSHSPLEPMNATAWVTPGSVEVWAPSQSPTELRQKVAAALGRPIDQVTLHLTLLGGGFGRRLESDYAVFAALVAAQADAPVQLLWTREEDMTHDVYRPRAHMTWRAALGPDGLIQGYEIVGAACGDTITDGAEPAPYDLPWADTQCKIDVGVPIGYWRSVDNYTNTFGRESFIDEAAHAAGMDPLDYRRRLLAGNARARRVLDAAAQKIGWGGPTPAGVGRGLALLDGWDTLVAHAAEVEVAGEKLTVRRIAVAIDPGTVVNPEQVAAQAMGGTTIGVSAALFEAMTVTDGAADHRNFDQYRILRQREAPAVDAIVLQTPGATVGGVGEPPVPGVAPALANAVFAACGKRVRTLPFTQAGFTV